MVTPIELPDDIDITSMPIEALPPNWDASEPNDQTRDIGTDWAKSLQIAVLVVPSAVIAREFNYLLNPRHPDFGRIRFLTPEEFRFDDRLRRVAQKRINAQG